MYRNNRIDGQGALLLHLSLKHTKSLKSLAIGGNPIGHLGAEPLRELLYSLPQLEHLNIGSCELGTDGMAVITPALSVLHHLEVTLSLNLSLTLKRKTSLNLG